MKRKLLFIFNPYSGKRTIKNKLLGIIDVFVKAGFEVTAYPTQGPKDATAKTIADSGDYDRIVCSGGDGTLDEVITGLIKAGRSIPVGYIPAGSTNDFGKSLGIPLDMKKAAVISASDNIFSCDIGRINDRTFVYVAAFGIFTETSYLTPQSLKNIMGHAAYVMEGFKSLYDITSYAIKVEYDGNTLDDEFIFGMITNSQSVGGFKGLTGKDVRLDDGLFEVTLIKKPNNPIELNEIMASLTTLIDDSDMILTFKTNRIKMSFSNKASWTLDGEFGGLIDEADIECIHKGISILRR